MTGVFIVKVTNQLMSMEGVTEGRTEELNCET
jgi:hypothetical protein